MSLPGPSQLGRGVVIPAGARPDAAWASSPRIVIGQAELNDPSAVVAELHALWASRSPVVIELAVDATELRSAPVSDRPVHELGPAFEFARDRLQFLVWANTYDARAGEAIWWHGRKVARRLAAHGVTEGGDADIVRGDGTPLYIDGGPPDPPPLPSGVGVVHRWTAEAGVLTPAGHGPPTADLAPDQLSAVAHGGGPARVIAPAGSGKTRVLTERLRHLVVDRGVYPGVVTALAYNAKAADEMRARCADFVTPVGPHIRTLNSIGLQICNDFGSQGRLRVLEEIEVRDLIQSLFDIRRQANTDTVAPYLAALSAIRLGLLAPPVAEEAVPDAQGIAEGFERYRAALVGMGAVDFDEQIYRAVEILLSSPAARTDAQSRCRRLLVDEFQDLNPAHLLLIRLLAAPGYDCFGVGDDDQVIYGYSGATPEYLIDFPTYFPGAAHHPLEVNYRCAPAIVDGARHLLAYNRQRLQKVIRTPEGRVDGGAVSVGPLAGAGPVAVRAVPAEELAGLAVEIIDGWRDSGVPATDIAVLARVNSSLLPVQVACTEAGVPCGRPLDAKVLRRTGIRTAFAYLRIGTDPGRIRVEDINETIRRPSRGIAPMVGDMLTKGRTTSVAGIRRLADRLSGRDVPKLEKYADHLDMVTEACGHSTLAALRAIRVQVGLDDTMEVLDSSRRGADRSTHADDLVALESLAALHPDPSTFESWLREVLARAAAPGPVVELSTVHKIKGKQWDRVIVFGASDGLFPHRLADDDEGERRVFHVALTRAVTQVAVLADAAAPSVFIDELDGSRPEPPRDRAARTASASGSRTGPTRSGTDATVGARPAPGRAEQALRQWRTAVAKKERVPAYVVLNDKELLGVVERSPGTLGELADCRGIGPNRLERWGDEILAVLDGSERGSSGTDDAD